MSMKDKILKALAELDTDKFADIIKEEQEKVQVERNRLIEYFNSPRFNVVLSQVEQKLEREGLYSITDDSYCEGYLFGDVSNDEFVDFCEVISREEISGKFSKKTEDDSGPFFEEIYAFEGLELSIIFGQGVCYCVRKKRDSFQKNG